mgnify:FL=1
MFELITINGKELPIKYGMNALRIFCKATNKTLGDLEKLGNHLTLDDSVHLIIAGLKDGHRKAGKPFNLTVEDISDVLDDDISIIERAMEIFSEQFSLKEEGNDKGTTPPKKKKSSAGKI